MAIFRQTELMFVAEIALRALGLMPVGSALGPRYGSPSASVNRFR